VLIDNDTLVIGYDTARGEPRGKAAHAGAEPLAKQGDCIDCGRCVNVCPTGIDIRQGLQMECIGCTACIDSCDDVMKRLGRAPGLIRYDSQSGFAGARTRWVRPRTLLYLVFLLAGAGVATWAASTVKPASVGVVRMTGAPYIVDTGTVRNQFMLRIVNKRNAPASFSVSVEEGPAGLRQVGFDSAVELAPLAEIVEPLVIQVPRDRYTGPFEFRIRVADTHGGVRIEREVEFLGPEARLLHEEEEERREHR
jgi:cytochrome c oxidase accessory protein FixG